MNISQLIMLRIIFLLQNIVDDMIMIIFCHVVIYQNDFPIIIIPHRWQQNDK